MGEGRVEVSLPDGLFGGLTRHALPFCCCVRGGSDLLVGSEVVPLLGLAAERAVGLLFLAAHLELREVHRHVLEHHAARPPGATGFVRADEHFVHLEFQIFLLAAAGLAHRERHFLEVLPRRARNHQHRRALVEPLREMKVRRLHLPRPAPAALTGRPRVGRAPAERFQVELPLVLVVRRLARQPVDLQKVIHLRHDFAPSPDSRPGLPWRASPPSPTAASTPAAGTPSAPRAGNAAANRNSRCNTPDSPRPLSPSLPPPPAASAPWSSPTSWPDRRPRNS